MALNHVVILVGGVGGVKLAHGLTHHLRPDQLTIIVNTGDDFWHYGLRICPDLDTVMYTLAGLVDKSQGWGIAADTTDMLAALRRYGEDTWFRLGDQDLATHLLRTQWLREGQTLTDITQRLTKTLGIHHRVLPMTNDPVGTIIDTVEYGELEFQVYFVRHRWQPTATAIHLHGIDDARMTPEVADALNRADAVIISPSNPWLSIGPILAVPGLAALIREQAVPRIALSPLIEGKAVKGPTAKLMTELGYNLTAAAIAEHYAGIINGFIYDKRDGALDLTPLPTRALNTLMTTEHDRVVLARQVLDWIENWEMI